MSDFLQGFFLGIGLIIFLGSSAAMVFCYIAKELNDENANDCV